MKLDRAREELLSAEYVRQVLDYNPETGSFIWKKKTHKKSNRLVGSEAGCSHNKGYRMIVLHQKRFYAHRLAWLYVTGFWPDGVVDHRDRNTANNRFGNLYVVTVSGNGHNMKPADSPYGPCRGVRRRGNNWCARIQVRGRPYYLGSFPDYEEAARSVEQKKLELKALS